MPAPPTGPLLQGVAMPNVPPSRREGQRAPLRCALALSRSTGRPIAGRTVDIGLGGMRVTTDRPLSVDEVLLFDLALGHDDHVGGQARVLRQERHDTYALRFEVLSAATADALAESVTAAV